jgi:hypothetical protein
VSEAAQHPGGPVGPVSRGARPAPAPRHAPRTARRRALAGRLRRAAALLTGSALLAALATAQTGAAQTASADTATSPLVKVAVTSLTPTVPRPGGTLTLTGTVTNEGKQTVQNPHVGVRIAPGGPLGSRSAITEAAAKPDVYQNSDGLELPDHLADLPALRAGKTRSFTLTVPVDDLPMNASGVYQLGVSLTGLTADVGYNRILGIQRTFLPWYAKGDSKVTKVSYLWPLIDRPHLAVRTESQSSTTTPIFRDDDLAAELAPGGRLDTLLAQGRALPVSWVVDPDLLASVEAMTKPYQVAGKGGDFQHTTTGKGTAAAKAWLGELRQAVAGHQVIALPFADPDLASIAHHGRSVHGTLGRLHTATELATVTVRHILDVTPATDVAWPVDGAVDPSVVSTARSAGAHTVVARSDSLSESPELDYTPNAARPIGHGTTGVVADAQLSEAFQGSLHSSGADTAAVQTFTAETLMIAMQAPGKARDILVAPQREPTSAQARAMAQAIRTVDSSAWAKPVGFSTTAKAKADPQARRSVPGSRSYPRSLRRQELSTAAFRQIAATQSRLNGFMGILTRRDKVLTPFTDAMLRSASTGWRGHQHSGRTFRDGVDGYLSDLMGLVHLLDKKGTLTLSGRSATIPITVKNELGQPVKGLEVRLTSSQGNSLKVGDPQPVTVEGGLTRSLKFDATASRNGWTLVTAQLYTADGKPYGEAVTFRVDVTSITSAIMLVIAGGLLLLVLAGVRMYRQRQKRAALREAAADGPDDGGSGDGDDGGDAPVEPSPDGEQPGDPGPDTAAESTGSSGTGEKVER